MHKPTHDGAPTREAHRSDPPLDSWTAQRAVEVDSDAAGNSWALETVRKRVEKAKRASLVQAQVQVHVVASST